MQKNTHTFGDRLKIERERLGLSQSDAAEACGVRREMWGKYERGTATPGCSVLERFSAHGGDVLYVLVGRREPLRSDPPAMVSEFVLAVACASVAEAFDRYQVDTSEPFKRRVVEVVRIAADLYNSSRWITGSDGDALGRSAIEIWRNLAEEAVLTMYLHRSIASRNSGPLGEKT